MCTQFYLICTHSELLKLFTTSEIMRWQHLCSTYEAALRAGTKDEPCTPMFIPKTTLGDGRWTDLKHRVVEHVSCRLSTLYMYK